MKYRLLREHRINRQLQPVGYEIELPDQVGAWLVEQGAAEQIAMPASWTEGAEKHPPVAPVQVTQPPKRLGRCCGW